MKCNYDGNTNVWVPRAHIEDKKCFSLDKNQNFCKEFKFYLPNYRLIVIEQISSLFKNCLDSQGNFISNFTLEFFLIRVLFMALRRKVAYTKLLNIWEHMDSTNIKKVRNMQVDSQKRYHWKLCLWKHRSGLRLWLLKQTSCFWTPQMRKKKVCAHWLWKEIESEIKFKK